MNRSQQAWAEHDRIVGASAYTWIRDDRIVHTNPGGFKNFSVNGESFPDVIVTSLQNQLIAVEEIETEDSVTDEESKQWIEYAAFGVSFNLIVPVGKLADAQILVNTKGIDNIRIQGYSVDSVGRVAFQK